MRYSKMIRIGIAAAVCTTMVMTAGGCGLKKTEETQVEVTPTPVPTAMPTQAPMTTTPIPTSTPAPRLIGVKTTEAKFIYLTNKTDLEIREIYLELAGLDEDDWGKNLIPSESSIKASEQVQMYYTPDSGEGAAYNLKFVDGNGGVYVIYGADLADMEKASFMVENDAAYLSYLSVNTKSETNTNDSGVSPSEETTDENTDDTSSDESGDSSYDANYDSSYDSSYDDSYDNNYDQNYDNNYDDSYDNSYDNGDDGSYDDSYDDSYNEDYDDSDDNSEVVIWDENGNWN